MIRTPEVPGERTWLQIANREIVTPNEGSGFRWAQHGYPEPGVPRWNYHPEYEIHVIASSEGRWMIGDKVGIFAPGHVALIGPNLPHDWVSFLQPGEYVPRRDTVVQFTQEWFTNCATFMPELDAVRPRLEQCRTGLLFRDGAAVRLAAAVERIGHAKRLGRLGALVEVFEIVAEATEAEVEPLEARYPSRSETRRSVPTVDVGLDYILKNIAGKVTLEDAARLANMSASAFSRYFKRASGLTFTEMTIKLRITNACRLLALTDAPVASIAEQVGYTNQSNFNRQFLRVTGTSPRDYRASARLRPLGNESYHV